MGVGLSMIHTVWKKISPELSILNTLKFLADIPKEEIFFTKLSIMELKFLKFSPDFRKAIFFSPEI